MKGAFQFGFYGDDFTGSTDSLEVLSKGGVRSVLFPDIPDHRGLSILDEYEAVGIAGITRSLGREKICTETRRIFEWFSRQQPGCLHYKVCSTLDSSPDCGNIGIAIEQGQRIFNTRWVPMLVGYPELKRWVAFSNLFASDSEGVSRLDRHSTMRSHPVTPMDEADIRLHLRRQTDLPVVGFDLLSLRAKPEVQVQKMEELTRIAESGILLFDTVDNEDLLNSGNVMRELIRRFGPFVVGSSAVEAAWVMTRSNANGRRATPPLRRVDPFLVMAGSASPKTRLQIQHARELGWAVVGMEPWNWFAQENPEHLLAAVVREALENLGKGRDVVLYTCEGPDDPSIARTRKAADQAGWIDPLHRIGSMQGIALRMILESDRLQRVCVAGGDTSGHVSRELGIYALEYAASIDPGAPVCRARSIHFDNLEISLKGGQVGTERYFESVKNGGKVD